MNGYEKFPPLTPAQEKPGRSGPAVQLTGFAGRERGDKIKCEFPGHTNSGTIIG